MVKNGYYDPVLTVGEVSVPKPKEKWNDAEKRRATLNAKAMNSLICALDKTEFDRISHCLTTQEIWNTLEVTHEGTS